MELDRIHRKTQLKHFRPALTNRAWNNASLPLPLHHQSEQNQTSREYKAMLQAWLFCLPTVKDISHMNSLRNIRAP